MKKTSVYLLTSLIGTTIVMWQLLARGYVLTLDMIFGPHMVMSTDAGNLINTLPLWKVISFLTWAIGGMLTEKILLVVMFFLLLYLPLHFWKKIFNVTQTYGAEYAAAILFAINPFVYERFLAGQWNVILGYALLFPLVAYLVDFCRITNARTTWKSIAIFIVLGAISTHIFIISILIATFVVAISFIRRSRAHVDTTFLKHALLLAAGILILSSYWLVPDMLTRTTTVSTFGPEHWSAFATAGHGNFGTLGNVLQLQGFWGEHEVWINRFILPSTQGWIFYTALTLILLVAVYGIYKGLRVKRTRGAVVGALVVVVLAIIFSCGVGEGIFHGMNMWIFEHISFWKGFRDSEKWSALIAFGYSVFVGLGSWHIVALIKDTSKQRIFIYISIFVILAMTPAILFGISGQLRTVSYPDSWTKVNETLKADPTCKALFLPWHGYYSLKWNSNILTANLAKNFFDCDIVNSQSVELGNITSEGVADPEYDYIDSLVTNNMADPAVTLAALESKGIKYIIYTGDVSYEDQYTYPFFKHDPNAEISLTKLVK